MFERAMQLIRFIEQKVWRIVLAMVAIVLVFYLLFQTVESSWATWIVIVLWLGALVLLARFCLMLKYTFKTWERDTRPAEEEEGS